VSNLFTVGQTTFFFWSKIYFIHSRSYNSTNYTMCRSQPTIGV